MQAINDWGVALWTSLTAALGMVFAFIPKLIGFLVILLVGWLIASLLERAVTALLRKVGFDTIADRIGLSRLEQQMNVRMDAAAVLGKIVFWFVFLIFLVPAVEALGLTSISNLVGQVVAYIPNVFVAILVLFLGTLLAGFVADLIRGAVSRANVGNPNIFANIARFAILGFAALVALQQLQIASALIQTLFTAIVGAVALAFGLAFGLGGRDNAARLLERSESSLSNATQNYQASRSTEQNINQARSIADLQAEQARAQYAAPTPPPPAGSQPYVEPTQVRSFEQTTFEQRPYNPEQR